MSILDKIVKYREEEEKLTGKERSPSIWKL